MRGGLPIDFDATGGLRDGRKALLRLERSASDWRRMVDRWRGLAGDGAAAPEAHVVLKDDDRVAYLIVRAHGDSLEVLEAAGDGDAVAGAAGAIARGLERRGARRRLALVLAMGLDPLEFGIGAGMSRRVGSRPC